MISIPAQSTEPVSNLNGSDSLQWSQTTGIRNLSAKTPTFVVGDANGDRILRLSLRGLRENNFGVGESAVGIYLDDVPFTDVNTRETALFGVSEIETSHGPHGTKLGAARAGGLIQLRSLQPDNDWRGGAQISYGNYKSASIGGRILGPIVTNKLFFGFSGIYDQRNGFARNTFDDSSPDKRQLLGARAALHFKPNDLWGLSLTGMGSRARDGTILVAPLNAPDPFIVNRDYSGNADTDSATTAFKARYTRETWEALSVTTARIWQQDIVQDYDFGSDPIAANRIGFSEPDSREFVQELRVSSLDDGQRIGWSGGAFISLHDFDGDSGFTQLPPAPQFTERTIYTQDKQNYALFGRTRVHINDQLNLIGGLRWDHDQRTMKRGKTQAPFPPPVAPVDVSDSWNSIQPTIELGWQVDDSHALSAAVKRGYQSGGFNPFSDDPSQLRYDSSKSWTFELAAMSTWFDNKLSIDATVFHTQTSDYQVFRPAPTFTALNYQMMNADNVHSTGAELEVSYSPINEFQLNGGIGFTHAVFGDFVDAFTGTDFGGNRVNFVPQFTTTLGAQYRFEFGVVTRIETQVIGKQFWDEANSQSQNAYVLVNATVGYERGNFGIYAWAKNLTDTRYFNNALDFGSDFGGQLLGTPGDPATFGVTVTGTF